MDRKIHITFMDATDREFSFDHLRSLYEFAKRERDFWRSQEDKIENASGALSNYINCHTAFDEIIKEVDDWGNSLEAWDNDLLQQAVDNNLLPQLSSPDLYLWSGHPFVTSLIDCHIHHGETASAAFIGLVAKHHFSGISNKEEFFGLLAGYEFIFQGSDIVKRRKGEKVSLGHLRNQLTQAKDKLFAEVEAFKTDYNQWNDQVRSKTEELHRNFEESDARIIQEQGNRFDEKFDTWEASVNELEKTYEEKLRLSKPAEYWSDAAKKFRWEGTLLGLFILILLGFGLYYFVEFFTTWLQGQELAVKLDTLQGAVLFATGIAIYSFLIRVLSRLAFSSFHLMRDAEERKQLTYLYLALSRETEVNEGAREIVLQALFSRSMTGLLAQEHGPTIPGASDALGTISKSGKQ